MEKPTKILLIGVAASVLIFGAGYFVSSRAEKRLVGLVSACNAESIRMQAASSQASSVNSLQAGPWAKYQQVSPASNSNKNGELGKNADDDIFAPSRYASNSMKNEGIDKNPEALSCERWSLRTVNHPIEREIMETYDSAQTAINISAVVALLLLLFSALPFTWYFLLRRIRELRDAFIR